MPRIRAASVVAHRELMWGRLLDAFGELLAEKGYADLTLAEVAGRAGMARNTIYNYAHDKEALLMAFIARAVEGFVEEIRTELDDLLDAPAKLTWLITRQMRQFVEEPGGGDDSGMLEGHTLRPGAHGDLQARFEPLRMLMAEIVETGAATGELRHDIDAAEVVPMIYAVVGSERIPVGNGSHDAETAAARVTSFVLAALR